MNEVAYRQVLARLRESEDLLRAFRKTTVAQKFYPQDFLARVDLFLSYYGVRIAETIEDDANLADD